MSETAEELQEKVDRKRLRDAADLVANLSVAKMHCTGLLRDGAIGSFTLQKKIDEALLLARGVHEHLKKTDGKVDPPAYSPELGG